MSSDDNAHKEDEGLGTLASLRANGGGAPGARMARGRRSRFKAVKVKMRTPLEHLKGEEK